jgi:hypothetical protein
VVEARGRGVGVAVAVGVAVIATVRFALATGATLARLRVGGVDETVAEVSAVDVVVDVEALAAAVGAACALAVVSGFTNVFGGASAGGAASAFILARACCAAG